jgi:enolase-phosphatase E1
MVSQRAIHAWSRAASPLARPGAPLAVVLDLEGTIMPTAFVRDTLFPYARERLSRFVHSHRAEERVGALLGEVAALTDGAAQDVDAAIRQLLAWSDADQKIPPLKALQGMIWDEGFSNGTFRAPLYPEVGLTLKAWQSRGIALYIYSSGSVEAQRLLLRHTSAGDLSPQIRGYFDATIGPKLSAASYRTIQGSIGFQPSDILFLSDHPGEIHAARQAGWQAVLIEREGPVTGREPPAATDFIQLAL